MAGQDGVVHAAGLGRRAVHRGGPRYAGARRRSAGRHRRRWPPSAPRTIPGCSRPSTPWPGAAPSSSRRSTPSGTASPTYDAKLRHIPSLQEEYVRSASRFGMEVTRQAVRRGVRISAGSDHVSYGPASDRATLFGELRLLVDSIGLSPTAALLAATRDAARAIGGAARHARSAPSRRAATPTWCCWPRIRWKTSPIWSTVELVMVGGKVWRPGQLRSGIAMR